MNTQASGLVACAATITTPAMTMPWIDRVRARHQRSMQGGRHLADNLNADQQREDEQSNRNNDIHCLLPFLLGFLAAAGHDHGVVKLFVQIDGQLAVTHEMRKHIGHIAAQQVGCGSGNAA